MHSFDDHDDSLPADAVAAVDTGLGDANAAAAPLHEVRALGCFARGASGQVLGGAVGRSWGGCAELQQLWVHAAHRRAGLGAQLVRRFETRAAERGCRLVYLDTFSFQAPRLYRALGYEAVHINTQFPHGIRKYTMQRVLVAPAAATSTALPRGMTLRRVQASDADLPRVAHDLAALLQDAVVGGASVGYVLPLSDKLAASWAASVLAQLGPGLQLWLAEHADRAVGTVQLAPCMKPNGRHRAELMKLLVAHDARGQGVARALMAALEDHARAQQISLLMLDTQTGSAAEALYLRQGWRVYGEVPGHALDPAGRLQPTTCLYKTLA